MSKIAITVEANTPDELVERLQDTISRLGGLTVISPGQDETTEPSEQAEPAPQTTQEPTETTAAEAPTTEQAGTEPDISMETVRALLVDLNQAGKQAQIKELLSKYGSDRLSGVKPEDYGRLYADAQELAS